jgi:hypothetical protein
MKKIQFSSWLNLTASGKVRKFQILAYSGGLLRVDGFANPVVVDLAGLQASASVPIILDHQPSTETTLGQTSDIRNDGRSLVLAGQITGQSGKVLAVVAQADAGYQWQASIGCSVEASEDVPAGSRVVVNGQTFVGPIIVARRTVLRETSVLPVGADASTQVNLAASAKLRGNLHMMTFAEWLMSLGLDESMLTPEAADVLQTAYDATDQNVDAPAASTAPVAAPAVPVASAAAILNLRATASAELHRHSEINKLCVGHPQVAAKAISAGWSPLQAENSVLKLKAQSMAPSNRTYGHSGHSTGLTKNTLSASLMLRAGHESAAVKSFGADVCQQARDLRCTNLVDLAAHALTVAGQDRTGFQNNDAMIRAAFSVASLSNILGDSIGKTLVDAYQETTSAWKSFCHIGDCTSFRDHKGIRPAAIASLDVVGAGGAIKNGNLSEEDSFTFKVDTFAKIIVITRKTMVDDDLNFLSDLAPMLGVAAGRSLNDLLWSTILGGQTANYFSSGNANLATTSSALAVATLGAAVAAMRSQRDDQGFDLNIQPAVLVVPPALELTARALLNSADVLGTSGPAGNPVKNIVSELIVEPRISNSTRFSNTSSTQFYVFGAPKDRAVTVGFLNGATTPTIETADADFNTLGMQIRVFHDFGVALADPRGAYKATGAA